MRKFRGVPRSGFKYDTTEQPYPAPAKERPRPAPIQELGKQRYRLAPVRGKGQEVTLYDIFEGDEWRGSRRTAEQCVTFLKTPLLLLD